MGCRILRVYGLFESNRYDLLILSQDGTHGHLTQVEGVARLFKGECHQAFMRSDGSSPWPQILPAKQNRFSCNS